MNPRTRNIVLALLCVLMLSVPGCRFAVGMLRSVMGDTMVPSVFEARTSFDLTKGEKKLLVLCTTSHRIAGEDPSMAVDVISGVQTRLKTRDVDVVDADDVANWIDSNGSADNVLELGSEFDADFVAIVRLDELSYQDPGSSDLYQGNIKGHMTLFEIMDGSVVDPEAAEGSRYAAERYRIEIREVYPQYPISSQQRSAPLFRKKTLDHICDVISRHFCSYHMRETI